MDVKKTGEFIFKLRKELGMTQAQLGEKVGVSDKSVSKWENGLCLPDSSKLNLVAESLQVSVIELINGEKKPDISDESINKILKSSINYYQKSTKSKYKRYLAYSGILFLIILFTILSLFLINNYDKCKVYRILSNNNSYNLSGSIILTNSNTEISLFNTEILDEYIECYNYDYELYLDNERIIKYGDISLYEVSKNDKLVDLNDLLKQLSIYITDDVNKLDEYKDLNNITSKLVINYLDENLEAKSYIMEFSLSEIYSNNKFIYLPTRSE